MAEFLVTDPTTGRKLRLTGDSPPTEQELEQIFASQDAQPVVPTPTQAPPEAQQQPLAQPRPDAPLAAQIAGAIPTLASGVIAEPLAGLAGIAGLVSGAVAPGGETGAEKAKRFVESTREFLTAQPPEVAQELLGQIGGAAETVTKGVRAPVAGIAGIVQAIKEGSVEAGAETIQRVLEEGIGRTAGEAVAPVLGPEVAAAVQVVPEAIAARFGFRRGPVGSPVPKVEVPKPKIEPKVSSEEIVKNLKRGKTAKVAEAVLPDKEIVESAQRLGVDLNPEHISTNSAFQDVARALKTKPGSELQAGEIKALEGISTKADQLITDIGGSIDKAAVSDDILLTTRGTIEQLETAASKAYGKVRQTIPAEAPVDVTSMRTHLDGKIADLGGKQNLLSTAEKKLFDLIKDDTGVTYTALDRVRRDVGNGFNKRSGPFKDDDDFILREIYGVLSDAQNGVAEAFGIGQLYANARTLVSKRKALEDDAIALFGANAAGSIVPKIRQAATAVTKGDVTALNKLMDALPPGRRGEVAATILGDLFSGGARRGGEISTGFAGTFAALNRNQAAKSVLFKNIPKEGRKAFDDIGKVMTGIVRSNRKPLANPSGSAGPIIGALESGSIAGKIIGTARDIGVAEGLTTSVGLPGAGTTGVISKLIFEGKTPPVEAANKLLTSGEFKRSMAEAIKGNTKEANRIIEKSPRFKTWLSLRSKADAANIARIGFIGWLSGQDQR